MFMARNQLNDEQRNFFRKINTAAFSNPFGESYYKTKQEIAEISATISEVQLNQAILKKMNVRLEIQGEQSKTEERYLDEGDARLLEQARLYAIYLVYHTAFDDFIEAQISAGDKPIVLPFADKLLADFHKQGIEQQRMLKYIGLFYQTRRAYYFISRDILGVSQCMQNLRMHLWNNLFTYDSHWYLAYFCEHMQEFSTLLLGATGTGKTRIAQAIGRSNYIPFNPKTKCYEESFTRSFQSINLSQYPIGLLEAELFGHKKGAFTGAVQSREGVFARCSAHGAVFIDEVGEINDTIQVKLLNVLQDRVFTPVGSAEQQLFQGRVIAATNQNIEQLLKEGRFREDFYYRLCSDVITLPNLQQRLAEKSHEEMQLLLQSILQHTIGVNDNVLVSRVEQLIHDNIPKDYHWPGNVRELEQCVRGICLTGHYQPVSSASAKSIEAYLVLTQGQEPDAKQLLENYCRQLYQRYGTYEKVARISGLDRRTVKKHICAGDI
jgi:transcriptional regulator with AAA-type ATPase domain